MKKTSILLIAALIAGGIIGYYYHGYRFSTQLEEARNFEVKQTLDGIVYGDVTTNVQITCNFGNKETISGTDSGMSFAKNDFDSNGNFVNSDKNSALQKVCEISKTDVNNLLDKTMKGEDTVTKLFDVKLSADILLQDCLNKLKDPLGIGNGTDTEMTQRQECLAKFPPSDKNNPLGI